MVLGLDALVHGGGLGHVGEARGHVVLAYHDDGGAQGHGVLGHEDVLDHDEVLVHHEDVLGLVCETFSVALVSSSSL